MFIIIIVIDVIIIPAFFGQIFWIPEEKKIVEKSKSKLPVTVYHHRPA